MITSTAFAGKHYAVLGLARSGLATVEALLASGATVVAWDESNGARDALAGADHHQKGDRLAIEDFTRFKNLVGFDSLVVSPGVPLNTHPITAMAREAGVEVIGDIELFARARAELPSHKVVGITGTNGKSTTTALVHYILQTAGVPSLMGGNIGLPILAQDPLPEGGVYVLELSSYQLDLTKSLDCDVAVLLNITPDHLDRYESFEAYAASKARLFEMQAMPTTASYCSPFVVVEDEVTRRIALDWDAFEVGATDMEREILEFQYEWPSLQGPHNGRNALAAAAMTFALELVAFDDIREALRTFTGLPHRMERVRNRAEVLFVNDSKATNAEAAAPALAAFERVRWIVGGQAKAETLGDTARHLDHVVKAYTIGEAAQMFARLLRDASVEVAECGTLNAAVKAAAADAEPGDTVLLSPACASFDQFKDFEARGEAFRAAVEAL